MTFRSGPSSCDGVLVTLRLSWRASPQPLKRQDVYPSPGINWLMYWNGEQTLAANLVPTVTNNDLTFVLSWIASSIKSFHNAKHCQIIFAKGLFKSITLMKRNSHMLLHLKLLQWSQYYVMSKTAMQFPSVYIVQVRSGHYPARHSNVQRSFFQRECLVWLHLQNTLPLVCVGMFVFYYLI